MALYESTFKYKLIYIFAIHDADHEGFLKIGEASLDSTLGPTQIVPNCDLLNAAAHDRIKQYTKTALTQYELLHTELAICTIKMADGTPMYKPFSDTDIHDVLARSGYLCKKFPDTDRDSEWYGVNLQTAINAIHAFKEGRHDLFAAEKISAPAGEPKEIKKGITLRQEQRDAVEKTLNVFKTGDTMLWDCKMRFGKTVSAYELIKQAGFQKTIVVTHRPVVEDGWQKDHDLIFDGDSQHLFVTKLSKGPNYEYDDAIDSENNRTLERYAQQGVPFVYFASMQDLRGSKLVGGNFHKNEAVFSMDWDCIIYDEAHEGTQTDLGQTVQKRLEAPKNGKKPKVLSLSGTPYNLLGQYEENVYTWDYVMEQRRKREFAENHPDEHNPYENLPEMRILTFDLHESMPTSYRFETEDMAFNFREFFRTWTGDPKDDFGPLPSGVQIGDFVHEADVNAFLDLITREDDNSHYPFANQQYRGMFKHTFWMVPGVKEARALSALLREHEVFKHFGIANVAGDGDQEEAYDDALKKVRKTIQEHDYSITISCGKLTTGVTVPEWSAVMMLAGSASTAAAGYMQTIFRVQSVGSIDGKQKDVAYVFDFAPDRALRVLSEVHSLTKRGKTGDEGAKAALGEFLNFCPVLAINGTQMVEYDVPKMMRQMKKITVDKAIKSGFDDESIYNEGVGIIMNDADVKLFNHLASVIHGQPKSKLPAKVTINQQGMDNEQYQKAEKAKNKPKRERSAEEKEALEKQKKLKEEREKVLRLLRAVSIRLPMLIYGARVDLEEDIRMEDFITIVDSESWVEFMPANVTKDLFKQLLKYYDEDVVIGAGLRIRRLAKAADELPPTQRVKRIAEIFALFRNPDKETVLTPWRVVNMHMGDCIGGYNFYAEGYAPDAVLEEPRLIDNGAVTADIFLNPEAKLLEMNSKSGLYPLYLCYSLYAMKLPKPENQLPFEETQRLWKETLEQNIFVLCKTKMAVSITRRTLAGYQDDWNVHAICLSKLLDRMQDMKRLSNKLTNPATWGKEGERMKFDAVVGNPPYQLNDGGNRNSSTPVYQYFVEQAKVLRPSYISMITPSRWFAGGKGLDDFRGNMLSDERLRKIVDYTDSTVCFSGVDIAGGVSYFLWDSKHSGLCEVVSVSGATKTTLHRKLNEYNIFVRNNLSVDLLRRLTACDDPKMENYVGSRNTFGISTDEHGQTEQDDTHSVMLACSQKSNQLMMAYVDAAKVTKGHNLIDKYKVVIGRSVPRNGEVGVDPSVGYRAITTVHIFGPNTVFTDTYLMLSSFDAVNEAENFAKYMTLRFPRFLLHETYTSMSISMENFRFVPYLGYSEEWTDQMLYERYQCTEEEIKMIESLMRPLEYILHTPDGDIKKSVY